ncbi:4-(cytidine 5'-diphospho)-2-C-methyl-D-erythritol kinase [Sulfitobacter sp. LCG007]
MSGPSARVFAPAKINLALHVTGRRADGYHLLDSLVVFADAGDEVCVEPAAETSLTLEGPESAWVPDGADNLALRAAALFDVPVSIRLSKHLPVASGIGGGSADAAAVLRGMLALQDARAVPDSSALLDLGADIPVCVECAPQRLEGIGEKLSPLAGLPPLFAVLVNPRKPVSTPAVFKALDSVDNPGMPAALPKFETPGALIEWLADQRNDLEAPACDLEPSVRLVLSELQDIHTCRLARMSGSGATCFGLFSDAAAAGLAATLLSGAYPDWWVRPVVLGDQAEASAARIS